MEVCGGEETAAISAWQAISRRSSGIKKIVRRIDVIIAVPVEDSPGQKSPSST
jgi:hypothetical protein